MTDPTLRPARVSDAALLAAIHLPCFPEEPWPAAAMTELLESPGTFGLIAEIDTPNPVACGLILCRTILDQAEVLTLAVLPQARRAGLGRVLLEAGMARSALCGAETMYLEVAADNPAALTLYRTAGFSVVGHRPGYYHRATGAVTALVLSAALTARTPPMLSPAQP